MPRAHPLLIGLAAAGALLVLASSADPYEWYGDNLLAYVVTVLEEIALARLAARGDGPEIEAALQTARDRIVASLRAVWPAFDHRNIGAEALAYFGQTFPIHGSDRQLLVDLYILPIIARREPEPEPLGR
jgi:hypothetical protein